MKRTAEQLWTIWESSPQAKAWARVLRQGESYQDDRAWTVRYGGIGNPPKFFDDLSRHPRIFERGPKGPSSAAGAFQITATTWDSLGYLGLTDFTQRSQCIAMLALTERRGALDDVLTGRLDAAMMKCRDEWSSLPYNTDGQPTIALHKAHKIFADYGGVVGYAEPAVAPTQEEPTVEPVTMISLGIGLVNSLLEVFSPLAKEKISKELGRHTDNPEIATQITTNMLNKVKELAGTDDVIEAVSLVKRDPEKVALVEADALDDLVRMAPMLAAIHANQKEMIDADERSRQAALERQLANPSSNIQQRVLTFTMWATGLSAAFVGGLIALQMVLSNGEEPNGQLIILFVMLVTTFVNVFRTQNDYAYGASRSSEANEVMRAQLPRGK